MPRISVAIPSYNHEKYIAQAIRSVLDQTYQDFEIVITDDGSRDGTVDVIRSFADPRIRLFRFESNQGACAAMNNCLREAQGEYVAVLNSDDLFLPEKLGKQINFLETQKEVGGVFGYPMLIDENGSDLQDTAHPYAKVFRQPNRNRFEWLRYFFYEANALCHPSILIRRACYDKVGYYDERLAQMPDFDMWVRLCLQYEIAVLPENLIKFRIHSSETNASGNRPGARIRLVIEHARVLKRYLNIQDVETLYRVFPEASRYGASLDRRLVPFVIAMLALEKDSIPHRSFAVETLFDLLDRQEIREALRECCNFSIRDFIQLTGQYDLFNGDAAKRATVLEAQLRERQAELDRIRSTPAWKLLSACRRAVYRFLPDTR